MNMLDGLLAELFKTNLEIELEEGQDLYCDGSWICRQLNENPQTAYAVVLHMLKTLRSESAKMQFLYECKTCIEYALEEVELMKINPHYAPTCCGWVKPGMSEAELGKTKGVYQATLIKVDKAICHHNNILNLGCGAPSKHSSEYTPCQSVLLFYFGLKALGVEPRVTTDIAPIAKFMHAILGIEFKGTTNSDFYQKLRKAPILKSDKNLIQDLEIVRDVFNKVKLTHAVKLIDNEINTARREIKIRA